MIDEAGTAYTNYLSKCDDLAELAQSYISWDNRVGCKYIPSDGLCILATVPLEYSNSNMPESVCPVDKFFSYVEDKTSISPKEFKSLCI